MTASTYILNGNPEHWVIAEDGKVNRMNHMWRDRLESVFGMGRNGIEGHELSWLEENYNWRFTKIVEEVTQ